MKYNRMTFMSISGKSIKKFKRVFIHWIDIESSSEWTNTLEGNYTTYFWWYMVNEGLINDYGDVTCYPSSVIKKITYLKDEEEK